MTHHNYNDLFDVYYTYRLPTDGTWLQPPDGLEIDVREVYYKGREIHRLLKTSTIDAIEDDIAEGFDTYEPPGKPEPDYYKDRY